MSTIKKSTWSNCSLLLVISLSLAGCFSPGRSSREEIDSVPGVYTYGEGKSPYSSDYQLAIERMAEGDFPESEKIYRRLIELEPSQAGAYIGLGSSLLLQDRYEEAEIAYNQALIIAPQSVEAHIGLGSTAHLKANLEDALLHYTQAVELDPQNPDAHWGAAIVLRELGREKEAADHLVLILYLVPGSGLSVDAQQMIDEINLGLSSP